MSKIFLVLFSTLSSAFFFFLFAQPKLLGDQITRLTWQQDRRWGGRKREMETGRETEGGKEKQRERETIGRK